MRYQIIVDGEWVDGMPTVHNQRYRLYDLGGGMIESFWTVNEEEV